MDIVLPTLMLTNEICKHHWSLHSHWGQLLLTTVLNSVGAAALNNSIQFSGGSCTWLQYYYSLWAAALNLKSCTPCLDCQTTDASRPAWLSDYWRQPACLMKSMCTFLCVGWQKNIVASFPGPTQFSSLAVHTASDEKPARAWELGYFLSNDLFGGQTTKSVLFIDKDIQEFTAEIHIDIQDI